MTRKLRMTLAVSSIAIACVALNAAQPVAALDGAKLNTGGGIAVEARTAKVIKLAQSDTAAENQPADEGSGDNAEASTESADTAAEKPEEKAAPAASEASVSPSDPEPELAKRAVEEIPPPQNEIEKAAFEALDKHCARCHQDGKLEDRAKPAAAFGNTLHLAKMAKDPNLVIPGNPDGSELVKQILSGNMPYDIKDGSNFLAPTPKEEEIAAIRKWIVSLKASADAACEGRKFVTYENTVDEIAADLERRQDHLIKGMRYVTLTHLYNSCSSEEEMEVYRQATVKLLNSLSTNSDVLTMEASVIGEYKTIIAFNLDDLGWTEADWEAIAQVYPYKIKPDVNKYDYLTSQVSTKVPYVRGDWLAFSASRPPLYNKLLKLPATYQELEKALGLDTLANIKKYLAKRAGFQRSLVSQNNRLIERHQISTGYFWTSYDFAGNKGKQSLFEHPLGPEGKNAFEHDGGETIYSLPNGFNAYYLNEANGKSLDKGPTEIVRDKDRKDLAVTNGISCMGCHDQGIRLAQDDIREHIINDRNHSKELREEVEALYPPKEEMNKILKEDTKRFQDAVRRAGIDPSLKLDGIEIINALSNKYEKDVHLRLAAAEFGLEPQAFEAAAGSVGGEASLILRRLQQAVVPRDNLEGKFASLLPTLTDHEMLKLDNVASDDKPKEVLKVAKVNEGDAKVVGKVGLTLIANKKNYKVNDLPVFIVQSDTNCHLTLINVDDKGTGTVLLPNKFQPKSFIKANQAFEFPGPTAPFQFRLKDHGTETVIALCNQKTRDVDAIVHNFKNKAFTDLGNYEDFVTRAIVVEANVKKAKTEVAGKKLDDVVKRTGAARAAIKFSVE